MAFQICLGFWLVMSLTGVAAGFVNSGASAFSPLETLSVIMIAAMMRGWRNKGAWSRFAVIMGTPAVLMGSFIYSVGAVAGAFALGIWGFDRALL